MILNKINKKLVKEYYRKEYNLRNFGMIEFIEGINNDYYKSYGVLVLLSPFINP